MKSYSILILVQKAVSTEGRFDLIEKVNISVAVLRQLVALVSDPGC